MVDENGAKLRTTRLDGPHGGTPMERIKMTCDAIFDRLWDLAPNETAKASLVQGYVLGRYGNIYQPSQEEDYGKHLGK